MPYPVRDRNSIKEDDSIKIISPGRITDIPIVIPVIGGAIATP